MKTVLLTLILLWGGCAWGHDVDDPLYFHQHRDTAKSNAFMRSINRASSSGGSGHGLTLEGVEFAFPGRIWDTTIDPTRYVPPCTLSLYRIAPDTIGRSVCSTATGVWITDDSNGRLWDYWVCWQIKQDTMWWHIEMPCKDIKQGQWLVERPLVLTGFLIDTIVTRTDK